MNRLVSLLIDFVTWAARRPRLRIRVIDDRAASNGDLQFEVENRGEGVTSLEPEIRCTYHVLSQLRIVRRKNRYFVREVDRRLDPFQPRILTATPEDRDDLFTFSWFITYTFRPARGYRTKVRIRNILLEPLGTVRFGVELARLRLRGQVRADNHNTLESLERLRRSQGPH